MSRSPSALAIAAVLLLAVAPGDAAEAIGNKVKTETITVPPVETAPTGADGQPTAYVDPEHDKPAPDKAPLKALEGERPASPAPASPTPEQNAGEAPATDTGAGDLPEVQYDATTLPEPVRRMREDIIAAAKTGDIEALRPVLESNEVPPTLSLTGADDPIDFLKSSSGDEDGQEILAILTEVLEAGFVHVDEGTAQEMYIWPYFARMPLDELTPPQKVELYKLLTAQDVRDMQDFGTYVFYRVGIGPDGTWHYFVAGE